MFAQKRKQCNNLKYVIKLQFHKSDIEKRRKALLNDEVIPLLVERTFRC
jgi:hypothetical protein